MTGRQGRTTDHGLPPEGGSYRARDRTTDYDLPPEGGSYGVQERTTDHGPRTTDYGPEYQKIRAGYRDAWLDALAAGTARGRMDGVTHKTVRIDYIFYAGDALELLWAERSA